MKNKVLTISIASYNTEEYIRETVGSLITEDDILNRIEIIIVNDGSRDSTGEIAHEFGNRYPDSIIVIDKKNGGYGSTINASLSIARGKYFKLLDGDDWFNIESIPHFVRFLEKTDADLVITPYIEVRENRKLLDIHKEISNESTLIEDTKIKNKLFAMHEIAIRTKALRTVKQEIAEHTFYTDSEYVFYCLLSAKSICRYNIPVYIYRLGVEGQSVSLEGIRKHFRDFSVVAERMMKVYCKAPNHLVKKKELLDFGIMNITFHSYRAYMLMKNPMRYKKELVAFDRKVKQNYPEAYRAGNKSKLVKTIRRMRFRFYSLLCCYLERKYIKEISA